MFQKDKNIAICKARGLEPFERFNNRGIQSPAGEHLRYKYDEGGGAYSWQPLPDHFKDLNAMHEAEKALIGDQQVWYAHQIYALSGSYPRSKFSVLHAAAHERAEAFGLVLNLWK